MDPYASPLHPIVFFSVRLYPSAKGFQRLKSYHNCQPCISFMVYPCLILLVHLLYLFNWILFRIDIEDTNQNSALAPPSTKSPPVPLTPAPSNSTTNTFPPPTTTAAQPPSPASNPPISTPHPASQPPTTIHDDHAPSLQATVSHSNIPTYNSLKQQDVQVRVHIIEARELKGR